MLFISLVLPDEGSTINRKLAATCSSFTPNPFPDVISQHYLANTWILNIILQISNIVTLIISAYPHRDFCLNFLSSCTFAISPATASSKWCETETKIWGNEINLWWSKNNKMMHKFMMRLNDTGWPIVSRRWPVVTSDLCIPLPFPFPWASQLEPYYILSI